MATKIELPRIFREVAFSSVAEQVPTIQIAPIANKIFAVPAYDINVTPARAEQLYTHVHHGISGHNASKQWDTVRYYGGSVDDLVNQTPSAQGYAVMSEVWENLLNAGRNSEAQGFVDQYFQKLFLRSGQIDPVNTNYIQDYYDHNEVGPGAIQAFMSSDANSSFNTFWNTWKLRFSSEAEARKKMDGTALQYFARGCYEYRNWMVPGYKDGFHRQPETSNIYLMIAVLEQMHLAVRRKAVQFCWDVLEGAAWKINRFASMQGLRFEAPPGMLYKATANPVPSEMMYQDGLITSLLGEGQIHWGPAGRTTTDIKRWVRSYTGGIEPWKNQWKGDGMAAPVDYNPANPTQPTVSPGDNPNNYTGNNVQIIPPSFGGPGPYGIHKALAGRYMASDIRSRYTKLYWPPFQYKVNGGSNIDGYFDGPNPVAGTLGDGSFTTLDNRNFEQYNVLNQMRYKKPILLKGNNVAIWCKPDARINEVNVVTIDHGGIQTFEAVGPNMQVFGW